MAELLVGIIMGSDSDLPVMKEAYDVLKELGVNSEVIISSAHRCPDDTAEYAKTAVRRGLLVLIAGAGLAAHLPGVIAANTTLPVIGVPIKSGPLKGVDALYSIVQMPPGVPVATVSINGAKNAGILAAQIIGTGNAAIRDNLSVYKEKMNQKIQEKNAALAKLGIDEYLRKNS